MSQPEFFAVLAFSSQPPACGFWDHWSGSHRWVLWLSDRKAASKQSAKLPLDHFTQYKLKRALGSTFVLNAEEQVS